MGIGTFPGFTRRQIDRDFAQSARRNSRCDDLLGDDCRSCAGFNYFTYCFVGRKNQEHIVIIERQRSR